MGKGLLFSILISLAAAGATAQQAKEPVDYVNPNIGGIGHLLTATSPNVHLPHAMVTVAPIVTPGIADRYLADKIYGFPAGGATLMAATSSVAATGIRVSDPARYASAFDHDLETATPYYYAVTLEDSNIEAEVTVSERAIFYRFAFPPQAPAHLIWSGRGGAAIAMAGPAALEGHALGRSARTFFYAEFSRPFSTSSTLGGSPALSARRGGAGGGLALDFSPPNTQPIGVRIGISYISAEQARRNLEREIPDWDFNKAKAQARQTWNRALGRIQVQGGTEEERTIFYTALYRSLSRMVDVTEDGQYYSGFDKKVHAAEGRPFYVDDGLWDTYRSMHPLQLLLEPEREDDVIQSYVRMYEQGGWLPSFPSMGGDSAVMIGYHAAALIADAYQKGFRKFDAEKAYAGLKARANEGSKLPWHIGPLTSLDRVYLEKGFFPALAKDATETVPEVHSFERRQAVSVTLETCYDDWCVAQLAKALGKNADYETFMKRAGNYKNLFDARIGLMAPKTADGKWVEGFDPKLGGGQGGRDYFAECNSWIYTFSVQHDVAGLIALMGGKEKFARKVDALFVEQYGSDKYSFLRQFPDATGLIGQYAQGDEPSFHIPYFYNYAGEPWKAQRKVREIMRLWYNAGPLGICGDEDGGAMSSWYVLSAMGFYPVCPGRPVYDIGSPIFKETKIALGGGKTFTITAKDVSGKNKYIQSAELNGKPLDRPWFTHEELMQGQGLVLHMGPRPNTAWGSGAQAAAHP